MVDITLLLEEIGLTRSEIKVYLALLEIGSSSTGPIVEKSGAASSKIYEVLEKLIQKGLVSFVIKSGVKHFEAASPKRLLDYMKEKQQKIEAQAKEVEKLIPSLEMKQTLSENRSETLVFKGLKGAQSAFDDILDRCTKGDTLDVIGFSEIDETFQNFLIRFHRRRSRQGIEFRGLFGTKLQAMIDTLNSFNHSTVKVSLHESTMVGTLVYKDTVLFSIAKDKLWIQVRNQGLADTMRERFEIMWNQDTTVVKGWDALLTSMNSFVDDIKKGDTFDVIGAAFGVRSKSKEYAKVFSAFDAHRQKKKISARWLFQQGTQKKVEKNALRQRDGQVKFLPYGSSSPVSFYPYKDKTMIMVQGEEPTVITINNKQVTEAFTKQFESLWGQDVIVHRGFEASTNRFEQMLHQMKKEEEYLVLGASIGELGSKLRKWFLQYHTKRVKKKIKVRLLVNSDNAKSVEASMTKTGDPDMNTSSFRILPRTFSSPLQINVYPNGKVLIFVWKKEPVCFEFSSADLSSHFTLYFEQLWNQKVLLFEGKEAIRQLLLKSLDFGDYSAFAEGMKVVNSLGKTFFVEWQQEKKKRNIKSRIIMGSQYRETITVTKAHAEFKFLPNYENVGATMIYSDKVIQINFTENPTAFLIEDKATAKSHLGHFEELWNQRTISLEGDAAARFFFNDMLRYKEAWFIGGNDAIAKYHPKIWKAFSLERIKKKIIWHDLIDAKRPANLFEGKDRSKVKYYEHKVLPLELSSPHVICFYGNKVANIIWGKNTTITIIDDENVFNGYKKYFDYLWKQSKKD